ncbi:hypothetical protein DYB25_006488 [Aphanomyces astaci]|uniref:15-cis-phytoene synthase n=1 Tax=Aphanomyces astaci TaxID=112090 RepID=A0A397E6A3_APHAT|nr:hypothetical protein DYB36_005664 [Aphanomyces astaci]RHY20656.1 hypothetical protein DYB25_006488 [Aphanomyces astaci]RHY36272.1 hypothetical protein DYB34_003782 [Aphanomyces astaci]RHY51673.1 hypothetical protein DYB38_006016 [Aphanomyces astaci]RHY77117.1 hypothetical protein DYB30_004342 [Aphanomyces astaci]
MWTSLVIMNVARGANQRRFISQQAMTLRESVRKLDYDHFLCGLLLPTPSRDAFYAIRAFNIEIARIKDSSRTNPGAGKLRIQWWRQRLHDIFDKRNAASAPTDHVVLAELHAAIHKHQLTQRWFDRILEAREMDLEVDNPTSMRDLDMYAEKTAASMLHLTLECLDHQATVDDVLVAAGAPEDATDDVIAKITSATFDVACHALDHMRQAQAMQSQLPRAAIPAFYTTVSSQLFLARLETYQFKLVHPELHESRPQALQWSLFKHSLFRSF